MRLILDLRSDSPTFVQSFGAEVSAENRRMMVVPKGFGHGFITLADDSSNPNYDSANITLTEARIEVDQEVNRKVNRNIRGVRMYARFKWVGASFTVSDPRLTEKPESKRKSFPMSWILKTHDRET